MKLTSKLPKLYRGRITRIHKKPVDYLDGGELRYGDAYFKWKPKGAPTGLYVFCRRRPTNEELLKPYQHEDSHDDSNDVILLRNITVMHPKESGAER